MKKRLRTAVLIVLAVGVVAATVVAVTARQRNASPRVVATFRVRVDTLEATVSGTGSFVPSVRRTVYSEVAGLVEEVLVSEGSTVARGEPLLRIAEETYRQSLDRAVVTYQSTRRSAIQQILNLMTSVAARERALEQLRRSHQKNTELRSANAISLEEFQQSQEALDEATQAAETAVSQLNLYTGAALDADPIRTIDAAESTADQVPEVVQAALGVEQAREALSDTEPTAPVDGTVAFVAVETGSLVAPNAPLLRIEQLDSMNAEVQIDEVDIGKLSVGNRAEIQSDSLLGETLQGTVVRIAPTIRQVGNTRVSAVEVSIDSGETALKSGASCTVRISTTTKEDALIIPITAYQTDGEEIFVLILEELDESERFVLRRRNIELGMVTVNFAEVASGLSAGDIVVSQSVSQLRSGMTVAGEVDE